MGRPGEGGGPGDSRRAGGRRSTLGCVVVGLTNAGVRGPVASWKGRNRPLCSLLQPGEQESCRGPDSQCPRTRRRLTASPMLRPVREEFSCFQGLMSGKPYLNVPSHEAREDARP